MIKLLAGKVIPWPWICGALVLALAASTTGNVLQHYAATAAAAECTAAAEKVRGDSATAVADLLREHAETVERITTTMTTLERTRLDELGKATARIDGAASNYRRAQTSAPLPDGCRASAERVQAVNEARRPPQ